MIDFYLLRESSVVDLKVCNSDVGWVGDWPFWSLRARPADSQCFSHSWYHYVFIFSCDSFLFWKILQDYSTPPPSSLRPSPSQPLLFIRQKIPPPSIKFPDCLAELHECSHDSRSYWAASLRQKYHQKRHNWREGIIAYLFSFPSCSAWKLRGRIRRDRDFSFCCHFAPWEISVYWFVLPRLFLCRVLHLCSLWIKIRAASNSASSASSVDPLTDVPVESKESSTEMVVFRSRSDSSSLPATPVAPLSQVPSQVQLVVDPAVSVITDQVFSNYPFLPLHMTNFSLEAHDWPWEPNRCLHRRTHPLEKKDHWFWVRHLFPVLFFSSLSAFYSLPDISSLSVFSGLCYGCNFTPTQWVIDNEPGVSTNGLDYVHSQFSTSLDFNSFLISVCSLIAGILLMSTFLVVIYCGVLKNKPRVFPESILPGFLGFSPLLFVSISSFLPHSFLLTINPIFILAGGFFWSIGQIGWFIANSSVSMVVAFPVLTICPCTPFILLSRISFSVLISSCRSHSHRIFLFQRK